MPGGWGADVRSPMEIPQDPGPQYLRGDMPEVINPAELPMNTMVDVSASTLKAKSKALPPMKAVESLDRGRREDAQKEMFAMAQAFDITKQYEQRSKARAKAKGYQAEQASKVQGQASGRWGKGKSQSNKGMGRRTSWNSAAQLRPDARQYLTTL